MHSYRVRHRGAVREEVVSVVGPAIEEVGEALNLTRAVGFLDLPVDCYAALRLEHCVRIDCVNLIEDVLKHARG
eukprot:SAG11_NODE_7201_length_1178_cov_2.930491_1_plen_74_part_00